MGYNRWCRFVPTNPTHLILESLCRIHEPAFPFLVFDVMSSISFPSPEACFLECRNKMRCPHIWINIAVDLAWLRCWKHDGASRHSRGTTFDKREQNYISIVYRSSPMTGLDSGLARNNRPIRSRTCPISHSFAESSTKRVCTCVSDPYNSILCWLGIDQISYSIKSNDWF